MGEQDPSEVSSAGKPADYKLLYEEERKKRAALEAELAEKERQFTEQYQKLLQVEQGIIDGEETIRTIEQEHIKSLTQHLHRERRKSSDLEKRIEETKSQCNAQLAEERKKAEEAIKGKDEEISALSQEVGMWKTKYKTEHEARIVLEESRMSQAMSQKKVHGDGRMFDEDAPGDDSISQTQDLVKILSRYGRVKLSEVASLLEQEPSEVMKKIRILHERKFVKIENPKSPDPTLLATKDLVKKISDLRMKLRRRGRVVD